MRLAFDPSNNNLVRIYLQADQPSAAETNGYYLEMGENNSTDPIKLFRQSGTVKTQLAAGQPGLAASAPNLHILAKRSPNGTWTVLAAPKGMPLQWQFEVVDTTWPGGDPRFFGFQCVYTSSNATRFYFDNVNIRPDVPDTEPPVLVSANAGNSTQVTATYNEDLDAASAANPSHFTLLNTGSQPITANLAPNLRQVTLVLSLPLATGSYTLESDGVKDLAGNVSGVQTAAFNFVKIDNAAAFDILINEIMADPSPSAGLPEVEWLELYNRSGKTLQLSDLSLTDATSTPVALPAYLLLPGEYVVVTAGANVATMQAATSGKVLGAAISTTLLNNDADEISLSTVNGTVVDKVAYSVDWHTIPGRKDGGYTLERINPGLPCLGKENWQTCPNQIGGTPAAPNASFSSAPDNVQPQLLNAYTASPSSIVLQFSEGMDQTAVENPAAYNLTPPVPIASAQQSLTDRSVVTLNLAAAMQVQTVYVVNVSGSLVRDCSGNPFQFTDTVRLGIAEKPAPQDFVINEILFNPATGGARFVEFFNKSNKVFDWSEFFLASNTDSTKSVVKVGQKRLFFPGEYHVFTTNTTDILQRHQGINPKNLMQNSLPSLDDRVDSIKVYWAKNGQIVTVDSFFYDHNMHNALLTISEREGVSLERIRTDGPTQAASNWTSASPLKTGSPGTPTLPNSQNRSAKANPIDDWINIPVARLSPDGDNREDFLEIYYNLPQEGFVATVQVFDSDGNLVKSIVRQSLSGTEGILRWDGDKDEGGKARPGIHVVYLEVYSPVGEVRRAKKAVAVVK